MGEPRRRHLLEDKVVGVAGRRRDNGDDGDNVVLREAGKRGVEGPVAGPEAGKGQDTLATELLNETALREDDAEDVAKSGEGDKDAHGALGRLAKHVAEERGGDEALGLEDLLLGDAGKVGDVGEHVEDGDAAEGEGRGELEGAGRVLGLGEGVVCVAVADEAPDDVVEGHDDAVAAARGALEGVVEVVDLAHLGQVDERRDDDDDDDEDLEHAEHVLQADPPLERRAVDEERGRQAPQRNAALIPVRDLDARRMQDVLAKHDGVAGRPAQQQDVARVQAGGEELGAAVDVFEVVLLAAVARQAGAELHVDGGSRRGDADARDPHEEREADAAAQREDGAGRGEDARADDAVEDEERRRGDADLALVFAGDLEAACAVQGGRVSVGENGIMKR